jgi:hypothetical protein
MKDLKRTQAEAVAGGLDPRQSNDQVAPEPAPADAGITIEHNPEHPPQ